MAGARTIWVVDDDARVRAAIVDGLKAAGHGVRAFGDGGSALAALADERPHILLSDVLMPGMTGVELAEAAQGVHSGLPVLLMSGDTGDVDPARLLAFPLLHKPFSARMLLAAVAELIDIN